MADPKRFYILDIDDSYYWLKRGYGYTKRISEAWAYGEDEAGQIATDNEGVELRPAEGAENLPPVPSDVTCMDHESCKAGCVDCDWVRAAYARGRDA